MRYLKTYEGLSEPEIGEYMICEDVLSNKHIKEFVKNRIGKYIKYRGVDDVQNFYIVAYEDVPDSLREVMVYQDPIDDDMYYGCGVFFLNEILYHSKSKADCEMFINTFGESGFDNIVI